MNVTKMTRRYARSRELVARLRLGVRLEGAIERTGVDLLRLRRNANAIRRIGKQLMQGAARSRLSAGAAEECFGEHGAYVPTRSVLSLVLNVNRDSPVIVDLHAQKELGRKMEQRPPGTLTDAITARDPDRLAQWASYYQEGQLISMRSLDAVCRVMEDIGYVLTGERLDETEAVWHFVAEIARERGASDRVKEVEAKYESVR